MKRKAKLTLGTLMACLIVGNVGFAENQLVHYNNIGITANAIKVVHGVDKITELGNSNYEGNIDESGKVYGILATDEGTANLTNEILLLKLLIAMKRVILTVLLHLFLKVRERNLTLRMVV